MQGLSDLGRPGKLHCVPFEHVGAVHVVACSKGVARVPDTPGAGARACGKWGSATRGAKEELRTYARSPLTSGHAPLQVLVAAALIRPANSPKLFVNK